MCKLSTHNRKKSSKRRRTPTHNRKKSNHPRRLLTHNRKKSNICLNKGYWWRFINRLFRSFHRICASPQLLWIDNLRLCVNLLHTIEKNQTILSGHLCALARSKNSLKFSPILWHLLYRQKWKASIHEKNGEKARIIQLNRKWCLTDLIKVLQWVSILNEFVILSAKTGDGRH